MNNRKILITGGTGLLGKALVEELGSASELVATYFGDYEFKGGIRYEKADVRDRDGYDTLFKSFRPEVLVHTASIGSPDFAEKFRELTWQINIGGVENMIGLCEKYGTKLVFISSNGIYDGDNAPYGEEDLARPVNYYGETKLAGEKLVTKSRVPAAIVRPILMYGWHYAEERPNIVTGAIARLIRGESMNVYDDVFSNPLLSNCCAAAIRALIERDKYEAFNLAGKNRVSIFELIRETAGVFGFDPSLVKPVKQGFFNELVPRPKDTSYRTEKMEKVLGLSPLTVREGLLEMKKRLK